jgi:hypothetical protein
MALEVRNRGLYAFGNGKKLLSEARQSIAVDTSVKQASAQLAFKHCDPALHSRLVHFQHLGSPNRAAMPRDGQEVAKVAPIEHDVIMHVCLRVWQICISPNQPGARMIIASLSI